MRVVVALGGNALLRRGQELNAENQRDNIRRAAVHLAAVHDNHELVIAHGNGPQVGLLALMDAAYNAVDPYPLDVLGAETVGMIGYMIEQELGNIIPFDDHIVTVVTQIVVDPEDPAFKHPTKPVGPVYRQAEAGRLQREKGWAMAPDGKHFRRVVPSPLPQRIIEIEVIRMLVESGVVVICAGGGGIPVAYDENNKLFGVEAVIDKDLASGLLARDLGAEMFVMLTDVPCVYRDFGTERQKAIRAAHPDALEKMDFAAGSMGPKVSGACRFVRETGHTSSIGQLSDLAHIMRGEAGTLISNDVDGIEYAKQEEN
ncbi:MAG: carbamate kinase [Xanthomonadales bacterium]|nr:carbamate kinase [Gammaproteobacteria bacterium]MBT8053510.1 carbamate kinase [Gammaproteobacteria bacterium]NND58009.1 carbamate kinase [Xanthomonadales bacterium]NNK50825.1 carbamate kinase [Xanthomonadales bacterium]